MKNDNVSKFVKYIIVIVAFIIPAIFAFFYISDKGYFSRSPVSFVNNILYAIGRGLPFGVYVFVPLFIKDFCMQEKWMKWSYYMFLIVFPLLCILCSNFDFDWFVDLNKYHDSNDFINFLDCLMPSLLPILQFCMAIIGTQLIAILFHIILTWGKK